MRQEPDRRYQRVSELRQDVDRIRTTRPPPRVMAPKAPAPRPPMATPRKKTSIIDAMAWTVFWVALLGLGWGAFTVLGRPKRSTSSIAQNASPSIVQAPKPVVTELTVAKPSPPVALPAPKPETAPAPAVLQTPPAIVAPAPPPAPATPEILKAQAVNTMKWVLCPLDETVPNDIRQHLTMLREDLVDEGKSNPRSPMAAYSAAWQLCQALLSALDERDRARIAAGYSAAQAAANAKISSEALEAHRNYQMSWPQYAREGDQRAELQRQSGNRTALASEAQKVAWANRAASLGRNLDTLYAQFRAAMR
jgi:hypothetical protein